jgi:hypothetical protein
MDENGDLDRIHSELHKRRKLDENGKERLISTSNLSSSQSL